MKTDYDVIIIGSGPAGASCAKHLIDNGVKTLIIEKRKLPRYKCCNGLLSKRSLDYIKDNFGQIPTNIYCKISEVETKISKSGKGFLLLEGNNFKNILRDKFDHWLIKRSNVEIYEECRFIDLKKENEKIKIKCIYNNKELEFICNFLIAADGADSKIRKIIDKNYNIQKIGGFTIQNIYKMNNKSDDIEDGFYYVILSKKYSNGGFSWMLKKNDNLTLGTGWIKHDIDYLNNWISFVKDYYNLDIQLIRKESGYINYFFNEDNLFYGKENILIIGEACGLMLPFGQGIPSALYSGKYAGEAIINNKNNIYKCYKKLLQKEINLLKKSWEKGKIFN